METANTDRVQVKRILAGLIARAQVDPALAALAADQSFTAHYTLSDLGLEFHMGFRGGAVVAGMGAPPWPAEVRVRTSAATLDRILGGEARSSKATEDSELSLSGNIRLAMSQQHILGGLMRLYTAAREEAAGLDPAALSRTGLPPSAAASRKLTTPPDPREELVRTVQELYQMQLITATGGNASIRIAGREEVWITPSQLFKGDLCPEVMVRIDLRGNALDPDAPPPSSERLLHTEIYKARPEVQAVIHAHAPYATILGLSDKPFLPITVEAVSFGELPRVPFIMPGSRELAEAAVKEMGEHPGAILQNHGIVVAAGSLRRASNLAVALERTAQLILGCYAVGSSPPTLPRDAIQAWREGGAW